MEELRFQVLVLDKDAPTRLQGAAVGFGDLQIEEGATFPKEGGLRLFYHDLIMGRPFPLTFVTLGIDTLESIVAVSLFLHRELAIHPETPKLVVAAEMVDRFGHAGLAHVDRDLGRFFQFLTDFLPPGLSRKDQESRLPSAIGWVRQYVLEGVLPALPAEAPGPRILDRGTNGFVVAEAPVKSRLDDVWVELFRQGFLRGVAFGSAGRDRRKVLAARKSTFLSFDLAKAADIFNEAERRMGEFPGWTADELWLAGPEEGTLLLPTMLIEVLVRV